MKKLYLFMTALFVAIAANAADWYLVGDAVGGWSTDKGKIMTPAGTDTYKIDLSSLNGNFKFLSSDEKWLGPDSDTNVTSTYSGSMSTSGNFKASNLSNITITITTALGSESIKIEPQGSGPIASTDNFYLNGDAFNGGWETTDADYKMELKDGKYVKTVEIKNSGSFGIRARNASGTQTGWYWCASTDNYTITSVPAEFPVGKEGVTSGKNWSSSISGTYTFTYDPEASTLSITGSTPPPTYPDLVLVHKELGNFNFSDETYKATSTDGTYVWTIAELPAGNFKIGTFGGGWSDPNWGAGAPLTIGTPATMYPSGDNCTLAGKVTNATVTFNSTASPMTIVVEGIMETPVEPEAKYQVGFRNPTLGWDSSVYFDMTLTNGVYTYTLNAADKTAERCNINIKKIVGATNTKYGRSGSNEAVSEDNTYPTSVNGEDWYFAGAQAGDIISFNPTTSEMSILRNTVIGPSEPCTVYFNAGADWFNLETMNQGRGAATTGDAGKMQARLIKQDGTLEAAKDMTNMMAAGETELPIFSIDVENPRNYKGIQFQCKGANDLTWTYNSVKSADASDYKEAEWERYIYGPGSKKSESVNDCAAEQSYITFDEYVEIRDHEKETIYVIGGGFNSFEYTTNEAGQQVFDLTKPKTYQNWGYGTDGIATASKDDGVYLFPVTFKDGVEDITFKMSWINAEEFRLKVGAAATGDYDSGRDNRWWATFNLGIVGPTFAPKYIKPDGTTNVQQALKDEVIKLDDNGINYNVQYFANRARKISRYNQYNWWIKKGTLSLDATAARWVVIDTESLTSALVPFRPAPNLSEVTASEASIYDGDLSGYSEALGNKLEGSATSGAARITQTNTATGTATITVSSGISLFDYDYRVEYHLYDGDNLITKFNGKKDAAKYEIKLNNMVASDGAKISVRCFYYDGVNKTYFRSRTQSAEIKAEADSYDAPVAGATSAKIFLDGNGWNAHVTVPFSIKKFKYKESESVEKELVVYPDYSLDVTGDKCENIRLASKDDWHVKAGIGSANHTAWNEEGEYLASEHNWAELSLKSEDATNNNYEFQFVLEGIAPASTSIDELEAQYLWNLNIKAAYPFLLDTQTAPTVVAYDKDNIVIADTPASVRRKAAGDSESSRYNISMNNKSTKVEVKASKETDLSGVNDVKVAEDGEAELYNLQGIRVVGEPAPGIYLRRNGSKVEKVMIH